MYSRRPQKGSYPTSNPKTTVESLEKTSHSHKTNINENIFDNIENRISMEAF